MYMLVSGGGSAKSKEGCSCAAAQHDAGGVPEGGVGGGEVEHSIIRLSYKQTEPSHPFIPPIGTYVVESKDLTYDTSHITYLVLWHGIMAEKTPRIACTRGPRCNCTCGR